MRVSTQRAACLGAVTPDPAIWGWHHGHNDCLGHPLARVSRFVTPLFARFLLTTVLLLLGAARAHALLMDVDIDTAPLAGANGLFALDLVQGDAGVSNWAQLSEFSTDATLGTSFTFGDVSGSLDDTLTLKNTEFFNAFEQELTFVSTLSFSLELSENDSTGGLFPDRLSFFLLDEFAFGSLVPSSDPSGANELFGYEFTGNIDGLEVHEATAEPFVTWSVQERAPMVEVPEPAPVALILIGLAALLRQGMHRRRVVHPV